MQVRKRLKLQIGEYDWQGLAGLIRLFVFGIGVVIAIGVYGGTKIDGVSPIDLAAIYRDRIWFLNHLPDFIVVPIAAVFNWSSIRFMIAPISAIVCIIIAGAYYVQDIYALDHFGDALRYVIASMFAMGYPTLIIEKGEKKLAKNEFNLIDKIGGPGFVKIMPGNAAMFRKLRGPTKASVSETYFLAPFESVASAVNLDEQQGYKEVITVMSRDGIKVAVKDIYYRYRIKQMEEKDGKPMHRSPDNPYPFSYDAIRDMTFNLQVQKDGLETWRAAIERAVVGTISDFIISKKIDYLTAPRTSDYNARKELNSQLFMDDMRKRLAGLGAELLWVDAGHIEIEDESVDELRTNLWSVDWAGDANERRVYGDAIRQAYQELGRAEAQADLIMSIAGALAETSLSGDTANNVRRILLARTAQVLSAMSEKNLDGKKDKEAHA